jgi:hypothetical protein|tara:strand:+ start:83 stop:376 length:294 start_codon:yes stop_codon:yes gene_type:complete
MSNDQKAMAYCLYNRDTGVRLSFVYRKLVDHPPSTGEKLYDFKYKGKKKYQESQRVVAVEELHNNYLIGTELNADSVKRFNYDCILQHSCRAFEEVL